MDTLLISVPLLRMLACPTPGMLAALTRNRVNNDRHDRRRAGDQTAHALQAKKKITRIRITICPKLGTHTIKRYLGLRYKASCHPTTVLRSLQIKAPIKCKMSLVHAN